MPNNIPLGVHCPGFSADTISAMQKELTRPEGTLVFDYHLPGLCNHELGSGIILQIPAGNTLFRLERDNKLLLRFIHSSPGTGTRIAQVDLHDLEPTESVKIIVTWSNTETALYVGYTDRPCQPITGKGYSSKGKTFRVGQDGHIYEIGDEGVQVMGVTVVQGGQTVLQDTALDSWSAVVQGVKLLLENSKNPAGYLFEVVIVNQVLVMLATGFETYCKRRFLEMEMEGRAIDFDKLARRFHSKREIEKGLIDALLKDASEQRKTPSLLMIERGRIDFGNYDNCRRAYSTAYSISFGKDLNVSNQLLEFIQRIIQYRHRIVHISPMIAMLNQGQVPPDEPVFSKTELGQEALDKFAKFIRTLHEATLTVPAPDRLSN